MLHGLTSCVSFDYVINDENEKDCLIRDFNGPTNRVLLSRANDHEASTDFYKFFVLVSYNYSGNHGKTYSQKILYHLYRNGKQALSEREPYDVLS